MRYNLALPFEVEKAIAYLNKLVKNGKKIELKAVYPKRSNPQNRYLHAMINVYRLESGFDTEDLQKCWTMEEAKNIIKRACGLFYEKNGEKFLGHTSDLDTVEMTKFIESFRNWSAKQEIYLMSPEEYLGNPEEIDDYIRRNREYLV